MKILHIISSPRGESSSSTRLGKEIVEKLQQENPNSELFLNDLNKDPFPHLNEVHLNSFFTPAENRSPELLEAVKQSDLAIQEIKNADVIVIDSSMYNFGIPSGLKSWIDHIARAGHTFRYTESGPEGMVTGKKVYLSISTGGIYAGPMQAFDFTESYLRGVLGFLGMTDVTTFRVEGTSVPGIKDEAFEKAVESIILN